MSFRLPETPAASVPTPPANNAELFLDDATDPGVLKVKKDDGSVVTIEATAGADADAIHDNVAGEIVLIAEKATPVDADLIVIEDSEAANVKKRVQLGNLPGGTEVNDLDTDGVLGIADDQLVVGTGANTAAYKTLPDGAVAYDTATNAFAQASSADLSDGPFAALALDDLTDVTITAPATGAVLVKSAGDWVDGQVDLADADAVTGVLPKANMAATAVHNDQSNTYSTGTQDFQAATDVQVKDSAFAIHDNAAPTKIAHFQCSALTAGFPKTMTIPDFDGVLVTEDGAQALDNKTLNSPVLTTPALGTPASGVLTSCTGLPLTTGVTGALPIVNGGTGQVAQDEAFDALAPTTTKGDVIVMGPSGDNVRLAVGTDTHVLTANAAATNGVEWAAPTGGGGDSVSVNGSSVTDADLDNATPVAPAGGSNVKWQTSGASPADISAYLDWGAVMDGFRRKPFFYTDCLEASSSTTLSHPPWVRSVSSGTLAAVAGNGNHNGILRFISAAGANTGGALFSQTATIMLLAGGENFEAIINIDTLTNTTIRLGFFDSSTGAPIDGAWIEIPSTGAAVGKTSSNSSLTTSSTIATLSAGTWYRCRIAVNSDATSVAFTIWTDDGTQQGTQSNTTNIPTAAGRELGHGISCLSQSTVNIAQLDWMAMWQADRALTR